jgi:cell division protein FtsB
MKFRTFLIGLAALLIAASAAFFSVTGLSKLFAGASLAVMIMAGTLEFGKLITAAFLHEHWSRINILLRTYLTTGVVVLILITSMGIYGFLTAAYQETADELTRIDRQVEVVELKKSRYEEQLNSLTTERNDLSTSITELTRGLSNNVIQYTDTSGQLITTTSSATRRVLNAQLDDAKLQRDNISQRIEALTDSVTQLELQVLDIEGGSELAAEVGPLKYMAEITGLPMANVVNIFALLIVFVFDPLAVSLVLAFNTGLKLDRGDKDKKELKDNTIYKVYGEKNDGDDIPDDLDLYSTKEWWTWDFDEPNNLDDIPQDKIQKVVDEYKENYPNQFENLKSDIITKRKSKKKVDERDLDGDGIITEQELRKSYEQGGWKDPYKGSPYYLHPWFDWNKRERWINNRKAIEYWLKYRGGTRRALEEIQDKYPTDFDTKTY